MTCKKCSRECAQDHLYLIGAGFPSYCQQFRLRQDPEFLNLTNGLISQNPRKRVVCIQGDIGQGKTAALRHIDRISRKKNLATTWIHLNHSTGRKRSIDLCSQALNNLTLPGYEIDGNAVYTLKQNRKVLSQISSTTNKHFYRLSKSAYTLTEIFNEISNSNSRNFNGFFDWLRGIEVYNRDFDSEINISYLLHESGIGHMKSIDKLPFYKTVSFLSTLVFYLGLEGLTIFIDDLDYLSLPNNHALDSILPFIRKGWPFKYMNFHRSSRLNIVFSSSESTARNLRFPEEIIYTIPDLGPRQLQSLEKRISHCFSVANSSSPLASLQEDCIPNTSFNGGNVREHITNFIKMKMTN